MSQINETLFELFRSHGVDAVLQGEWITFPQNNMKADASIVREIKQQTGLSVQLDVKFEFALGFTILESFAGIGETREAAVTDALHNFVVNSLHVLLAAFLRPEDEQVTQQVAQEDWIIDGKKRRVTVGAAGVRGKAPVQAAQLVDCLERFEQQIKEQRLPPETHWVRLYYGQAQGKPIACEVLLDNQVWEEVQSETASLAWPSGEEFYSVRVFLVIQGETGQGVTPESAIARLVEIMTANPDLTDDKVRQALIDAGIPEGVSDRAYKFTQIAWGRLILAGAKISFSADYLCFDAEGNIAETGRLVDEPYFAAASRLGPRYVSTPAFQRLALSSADVNAVNNALHAGSKPENLVMAPVCVFVEEPTPAGFQNAQKVISQQIASIREQNAPKNEAPKAQADPFWRRLWKR